MTAAAAHAPLRFAGLPVKAWLFGLRIWIAMMAALYVSFWLQLESASSSVICVAILALPSRGQAYQKALYRFGGTVVGVVASIVIAGLFNGSRDLFLLGFASWMAACVYAASRLDGNRAYGAVLSGYTAAIVAVANIDSPQDVFSAGINRGAAIVVGIVAVMVFNDLLVAPDLLPSVRSRLEALNSRVRAFGRRVLVEGEVPPGEVTALAKAIAAMHPDITALPTESNDGGARAAAARQAVAAMAREVAAVRAAAAVLSTLGELGRERAAALAAVLDEPCGEAAAALDRHIDGVLDTHGADSPRFAAASAAAVLLDQSRRVVQALDAIRTGSRLPSGTSGPNLPLFRPREAALRNAVRAFIGVLAAGMLLAASGWPETSSALFQFSAVLGISAVNPSPLNFAKGALLAMPLAVVAAGVTLFLVLDGADSFPLLALAMAPTVFGGCLMLGSGNARLGGVGFLMLVFTPALMSLSNPQSYNPESYLFGSMLVLTAVIMLFVTLATVLPSSDAMRRRWVLNALGREFRRALGGRRPRLSAGQIAFRDMDRIGQLDGLDLAGVADADADLRRSLRLAALTSAAWRLRVALGDGRLPGWAEPEGRAALLALDPGRLRPAADRLLAEREPGTLASRRWAAATLAWMAALIERCPDEAAALRGGRA